MTDTIVWFVLGAFGCGISFRLGLIRGRGEGRRQGRAQMREAYNSSLSRGMPPH